MNDVDVYATGVLSELQAVGRCLDPTWPRRYPGTLPPASPGWRIKGLRHFGRRLRRAIPRRNAWHGYHAEPRICPPGLRRIGTGWTRRRALRSLERYMAEVCTTCGQPMDDPQWCSRSPLTGKGGHTHGGGRGAL